MEKIILEFSGEDLSKGEDAIKAWKYKCVLWEILHNMKKNAQRSYDARIERGEETSELDVFYELLLGEMDSIGLSFGDLE